MIISSFLKALGQFSDPRFRRVVWLGIGLTLALLVAASASVFWLVSAIAWERVNLPFIGPVTWVDEVLSWGGLIIAGVLSIFLMIPVASAITGLFLDTVARAVEDKHYPGLPQPRTTGLMATVTDTLVFLGVLLVANIAALAIYVILPPLAPVTFFALNGYLLGREYFQMAAMRHETRDGASALRKRHRLTIWIAGCLMALPLFVPVFNLVIPVLAAATFTHLYHRMAGQNA